MRGNVLPCIEYHQPQTADDLVEQQENIALVANLARYLGRRSKESLLFVWEQGPLTVFVDDDRREVLAIHDGEVVVSCLVVPPLFVPGDWWRIVEAQREAIRQAQREDTIRRIREDWG